ncbi:hypothetical protein [uncultured Psychroserpens sp.]|uniref:hypothetical protein n=1 Tax=uncultured Psychroserpens sp. TaxID=255436 RepID=UPI00260B957F|nr:hypothetical protein [uncultured Psychroserpens sp.]
MTVFDVLFYNVFTYYKPTKKKKANTIALFYISTLQCSLILLSGIMLSIFLKRMNTVTMSSGKAWALFFMTCIFIYFKNWIQYSGKKRKVLNAKNINKSKPQHYNIWVLWFLLICCIALSVILLV